MKKSLFWIFAAFISLVIATGCEKNLEDSQCDAYAQDITLAAQLYESDPSAINCGIYKTAIQNYLNSPCSNELSGSDRSALENKLNNLPC
jgi:hypothetical protein